jgi:hypothetical protein
LLERDRRLSGGSVEGGPFRVKSRITAWFKGGVHVERSI